MAIGNIRPLSNKKRQALRKHHRDTKLSHSALAGWFQDEYKQPISKSTLSDSLSKKWEWLDDADAKATVLRNRPPKWPVLDKVMFEWKVEQDSRGEPVTTEAMTNAAKEIWAFLPRELKMNAKTGEEFEPPTFSTGWLDRFKKRHGITFKKKQDHVRAVPSRVHKDMSSVRYIASQYPLESVYTMDECGLYWKRNPSNGRFTESFLLPQAVDNRIAIVLCTNADGSDKLPLHYIGYAAKPAGFGPKEKTTEDWNWCSNNTAWMTIQLMQEWLQLFYLHAGDAHVLLLMDDFSAHRCAVIAAKPPANIRIEFLPVHSAGTFQPLNQGIIYYAKLHFLIHALRELLQVYKGTTHKRADYEISLKDAIWWFHHAWLQEIKTETIYSCFRQSTLFDENFPEISFTPPSVPQDLVSLYNAVVAAGNITDAMPISDFLFPQGEDIPPISEIPTIPELVMCHLQGPTANDANESLAPNEDTEVNEPFEVAEDVGANDDYGANGDFEETEENDTTEQVQAPIGTSCKQHAGMWTKGIRMADTLLDLMDYTGENTPTIKKAMRKAIEVFARKLSESGEERTRGSSKKRKETALAVRKKPRTAALLLRKPGPRSLKPIEEDPREVSLLDHDDYLNMLLKLFG